MIKNYDMSYDALETGVNPNMPNIHLNIKEKLEYFIKKKKNSKYYISWCVWFWKKPYCE